MAGDGPVGSERVGVVAPVARVAVGGTEHEGDRGVGGDLDAVALEGTRGAAKHILHRRLPAQRLLEHRRYPLGRRDQCASLVGVGEQSPAGVADQIGRGLGAGEQQERGETHRLLPAERVVTVGAHEGRQQVVTRRTLPLVDLGAEVLDHGEDGRHRLLVDAAPAGTAGGTGRRIGPGPEVGRPCGVGAEEFGDDQDGQRRCQLADDVQPVAGRAGE